MGVMKELYEMAQTGNLNFIPTPALPGSGSKGIISAVTGTPLFSAAKVQFIWNNCPVYLIKFSVISVLLCKILSVSSKLFLIVPYYYAYN